MIGVIGGAVLLGLAALVLRLTGMLGPGAAKAGLTVGTDVKAEEITEFWYTLSASTYPPRYQRYRFYAEEGRRCFYHEKREGDHWPLREADITVAGTRELTQAEWASFLSLLRDGTVRKRAEHPEDGDPGPWLYLYWTGDRGQWQEYAFPSLQACSAFEELCAALAEEG